MRFSLLAAAFSLAAVAASPQDLRGRPFEVPVTVHDEPLETRNLGIAGDAGASDLEAAHAFSAADFPLRRELTEYCSLVTSCDDGYECCEDKCCDKSQSECQGGECQRTAFKLGLGIGISVPVVLVLAGLGWYCYKKSKNSQSGNRV